MRTTSSSAGPTRVLATEARPTVRRIRTYALRITRPSGPEERIEIAQGVMRAGAQRGNDLVLDDEAVSRIHFEITVDDLGFRLRDLGSTNGTFVDGQRARDVYLRARSLIRVGMTRIEFDPLPDQAEVALSPEDSFGPLIGRSASMRELFSKMANIAKTDFTVLVEGESGTGKELIAAAIHGNSRRQAGPLVVFDCSTTPMNLIDSELFGHEKGAFTGAERSRPGRFEEAEGGTLFLDEVGELPLEHQPKLLRALEMREIRRLGGEGPKKIDVRIVAATNRDLAAEVNRGTFRHDLYYRLAVVRVEVPPLRARTEDLSLLVRHFLEQIFPGEEQRVRSLCAGIPDACWRRLEQHPFRGNVRELRSAVERTLALHGGRFPPSGVELSLGPRAVGPPARSPQEEGSEEAIDLERGFLDQKAELIARFEERYLFGILARHEGKISRAAAAAGIDRMYFKRLLAKYQTRTLA